ncbi:insulin receptor-related protein [Drosophila grimshawi]|uniref:receptor protein-tyrosine kinase n=1 Tax=Drosophila grimshawi TaxID=7222 RepID=B4JCK4_DROGR|nr:insulin receptor-related protein [Drosophila grimshawi]EDW03158.1 GH10646 [Drosophila grimshawi]
MLPNNVGHMLLALATIGGLPIATLPNPLAEHKECTSIDIRNECSKMSLLDNCTVITGYVMITLISQMMCNYSAYSFPKLREITDFMIFTDVRELSTIRNMFPNLTVIRGRRLFLNYALGISNMPDLELVEFPSLVAIQRGHVYIGTSHKLCQLNGINWDRLTLSPGENHIMIASNKCSSRASCKGCPSSYCWSNFICQRFENDNVVHIDRNVQSCHEECLGGCHNATAAGCVVCRGLTDAGVCVKRCPTYKFVLEQYQRCYTREECVSHHGHFTYGFECVAFCPSGYKANAESSCVRCGAEEPCISVCSPDQSDGMIAIYNLADAEDLRGCQIVNGSLIITIRNEVNELQLEDSLSSIREIRGHLKIYRSSQLSSLKFLSNLRIIHGDPLENRHYAFILYDNKQLSDLWEPRVNLEFVNGGMFMHRNNKLCNKHIKLFQAQVQHDKVMDSLQTSDQEVLCSPSKLQLSVQARSHHTLQLSWPKSQMSVELELIYRSMPPGKEYAEHSELEAPVCTRINWQRLLLFVDDLQANATHYSYQLEQLKVNTRYACLLRTFGGDGQHDARSDMIYVQTQMDIPKPPTLSLTKKTDSVLTLLLGGAEQPLDSYVLSVYKLMDDAAYIDERNYCRQPAFLWQDMDAIRWRSLQEYDYYDCCANRAELADDQHFIGEMAELYRCSLDTPANCKESTEPLQHVRLPSNTTLYELRQLERYRLYSLQLQTCNAVGCSSATTLNERTNFTLGADQLPQLSACRVPKTMEYVVRFAEPAQPNGLILNYVLHYRSNVSELVADTHLTCVTRLAHARANFVHASRLNSSYDECAVRVHSLAGDVITSYVPITTCDKQLIKLATEQEKLQLIQHIDDATGASGAGQRDLQEETTELHSHVHGISIFVICFLFGCTLSLMWLMYKRRCWRKWPGLRRYVPVREQWLRERQHTEDREILVDGFETVRFQNNNSNNNNNNNNNSSDEY